MVITVINVTVPPKITAKGAPKSFAAIPLSKAPNSLDDPTNIELTAPTRPRISSGVFSCKMVCLITMEIPSKTPATNNTPTLSQNIFDIPKRIMVTPNPKTAIKSFLPVFFVMGM